jgi:hypothetical protein
MAWCAGVPAGEDDLGPGPVVLPRGVKGDIGHLSLVVDLGGGLGPRAATPSMAYGRLLARSESGRGARGRGPQHEADGEAGDEPPHRPLLREAALADQGTAWKVRLMTRICPNGRALT